MKTISPLKLIFFNYLRKQGYDPQQMMREEINFLYKEAEEFLPENPEQGQYFHFDSELYSTEVTFAYMNNKWVLLSKDNL